MSGQFDLLPNDDGRHALLEPPTPAYTHVTVRRALIVWLHCGQQNVFKHVCDYYHRLEALEEKLPLELRASSRHQEFNLLSQYPPSSTYLTKNFPHLYKHNKNDKIKVKQIEELKLEDCVFNLEGYHNLKIHRGVTTKEILKTSQIIRKYCKTHSKSLKAFLEEFKDFAKKTEANFSVDNTLIFIKKKYLKDELEMFKNMPRNFSFLDTLELDTKVDNNSNKIKAIPNDKTIINDSSIIKNTNKIRILINESRRKELMSLLPQISNLSLKSCGDINQNSITAKLIQLSKKQMKSNYDSSNI